jgi:hypothetical protein
MGAAGNCPGRLSIRAGRDRKPMRSFDLFHPAKFQRALDPDGRFGNYVGDQPPVSDATTAHVRALRIGQAGDGKREKPNNRRLVRPSNTAADAPISRADRPPSRTAAHAVLVPCRLENAQNVDASIEAPLPALGPAFRLCAPRQICGHRLPGTCGKLRSRRYVRSFSRVREKARTMRGQCTDWRGNLVPVRSSETIQSRFAISTSDAAAVRPTSAG